MIAAGRRDPIARACRPSPFPLDLECLHIAVALERPEDGVDRAVLGGEPEAERVVVQNPLDPVPVQRALGEEPEDEQPRQHAPGFILKLE